MKAQLLIMGQWFDLLEMGKDHLTIWVVTKKARVNKMLVSGYRLVEWGK